MLGHKLLMCTKSSKLTQIDVMFVLCFIVDNKGYYTAATLVITS